MKEKVNRLKLLGKLTTQLIDSIATELRAINQSITYELYSAY